MTEESDGPSGRPARRARIAVAFGILALLLLAVWSARRPIAREVIDRHLAAAGVPARYQVEDLGFGRQRLVGLVDRMPFVDVKDLERAEAWFTRHGQPAVFFGRFVPVVRSLVSLPAGIERMPRWRFVVLTAIGSGAWNTTFVLLGRQARPRPMPTRLRWTAREPG